VNTSRQRTSRDPCHMAGTCCARQHAAPHSA
jgi:hypothetical protein